MGPSGSGKSTLGHALAADLGCRFLEGDEFHPPENRSKMAAGTPLSEPDRVPFLDAIGRALARSARPVVAACSALSRAHRERLRSFAEDIVFVWVDVPGDELARRLRQRKGHFMPPSLLADQLGAFEPPAPPERFIRIDGALPTQEQLAMIEDRLATLGEVNPPG